MGKSIFKPKFSQTHCHVSRTNRSKNNDDEHLSILLMLPKALEAKDDESPEEYTYDWGGLRILTGIKEELEVRDSCNSGTNDHGEEVRNLKQWLTERLHEIRRTADEGQLAEKEAEASRAEILALSKLLSHFKAKVDREIEGEIQL